MKGTLNRFNAIALSMILMPAALFADGAAKDKEEIRAAALDYVQGWYDADGARMERAVHPQLAKRGLVGDSLRQISAEGLVSLTKNGAGKNQPGKKEKEITILDMAPAIASVKVVSDQFIDYLHLGKVKGRWVIINALWMYK
jgi:hypothetical protein